VHLASIGTEGSTSGASAAITPSGAAAAVHADMHHGMQDHRDDPTHVREGIVAVMVPREDVPQPAVTIGGGDEDDDGAPIIRGTTATYSPREGDGVEHGDVEMDEFDGSRMLRSHNDDV
jgi:hypothetical protein